MVFKWEGVNLPAPSSMSWGYQEIATKDSGRVLSGMAHKKVVAAKRKVDLTWTNIPLADTSTLLTAVKNRVFGELECVDPKDGIVKTKTYYTGDPTAVFVAEDLTTSYWNITMSFIEQ